MNSTINDKKRKLHIALTVIVMAAIFIHSALPGDISGAESDFIVRLIMSITGIQSEALSTIVRKSAHFTEFLILGICITLNLHDHALVIAESNRLKQTSAPDPAIPSALAGKSPSLILDFTRMWLLACLLCTAYSATDELHQRYVPGRTCSLIDVCIDLAGAAIGALIMVLIIKKRTSCSTDA